MMKFQWYLGIALIFCSDLFTFAIERDEIKLENNNLTLLFVNAIFRHGDRTLDKCTEDNKIYSENDDSDDSDTFYPGDGQLTNVGKKRAYQLGVLLRRRYNDFLGDLYYQSNVHARSTSFARCKMSLQLVLAALYPPATAQKWNSELRWQPVNVIYTPIKKDVLLMPLANSEYQKLYKNVMQTPEVIAKLNEYQDFMKNISEDIGQNITDIMQLFCLYHSIRITSYWNKNLPKWAQDALPTLTEAVFLQYDLFNYNDKLIRLNGGLLLRRIIDDMNKVINGTLLDQKINLFSAHDVTVVATLRALRIIKKQIPEFTSGIILELYEKDSEYFVQVLYYFGVPSKLQEVIIPGCEVLCPYDKFIQLTSTTTATNEEAICLENINED